MSRHPSDPVPAFAPLTSLDAILAAARDHGLALSASPDDLDQTGLDFLVVHARDSAGTRWVVRTPRRADVVISAGAEQRVLALLRGRLPVAIPDWRLFHPEPPAVIGYPRLGGTAVVTVGPDGPTWNVVDRAAPAPGFLDAMAEVFAALAAVPAEAAVAAGVAVVSIEESRAALRRGMDATREVLAPSPGVWARWQRWVDDDALWPVTPLALAHGDLHPGHLLVDDDGRVTGVLDWTEAKLTDPAVDLAMFHGCFGRAALTAVVDRLAPAAGITRANLEARAVERWAAAAVPAAEWALRTGNQWVLEHARGYLDAVSPDTGV
jgi:aminoglycoside phosphotransferase (APT) family kinase protein